MCYGLIWIKIHSAKIWYHNSRRKGINFLWNSPWIIQFNEWRLWKLRGSKALRVWYWLVKSYFSRLIAWKCFEAYKINVWLQSRLESTWSYITRLAEAFGCWIKRLNLRLYLWLKRKPCYLEMYWENAIWNNRLYYSTSNWKILWSLRPYLWM